MNKPLLSNLLYEPGILENAVQQRQHDELNDEIASLPVRYIIEEKRCCKAH